MANEPISSLPPLPHSWSALTWQQLCLCWEVKIRFGNNAGAARAAALLTLYGLVLKHDFELKYSQQTGECVFTLQGTAHQQWIVTPRILAHLARRALMWFDYPYGDPGAIEERDEEGNVIKERRKGVSGYVNPNFRDAMMLPLTEITINGITFALPQVACNNITWQQYRSLQVIVPQFFAESVTEEQSLAQQAQFLAHMLVPEQPAAPTADHFRPSHQFRYDAERAEQTVDFWEKQLTQASSISLVTRNKRLSALVLFHICFQVYQTAMRYYKAAFPLLFQDSIKSDPLRDALTGEVGTVNTIMKYTGYASQQEVYDSNLPFIFDILNTMSKEAMEIEKLNAKIKKR